MSDAQMALGAASRDYQKEVGDYGEIWEAYHLAKAEYEHLVAKFKLEQKATDPSLSVSMIDIIAKADDKLYELQVKVIGKEAALKAKDKRLQALQNRIDTGRSFVAVQREADKVTASGYGYGA